MQETFKKFPLESGQFFGLLVGDGCLSKSLSFCNSNPRYIKYFLKLSRKLLGLKYTDFHFYLHSLSEKNKDKILKKWLDKFTFLNKKMIVVNLKKEKNKSYSGVLDVRHFDINLLRKIKSFVLSDILNFLNDVEFAKGFVDGIFAAEGYADTHKSSIKAIITQNKGYNATLIEKALQIIGLRYYMIDDREKKVQFRIAHNASLHHLFSFCGISIDKLWKLKKKIAGKYGLSRNKISHKILEAIKNNKLSIPDMYKELKEYTQDVIYWYLKNKKSPLLKNNLIEVNDGYLLLTEDGMEVLKTLWGTS